MTTTKEKAHRRIAANDGQVQPAHPVGMANGATAGQGDSWISAYNAALAALFPCGCRPGTCAIDLWAACPRRHLRARLIGQSGSTLEASGFSNQLAARISLKAQLNVIRGVNAPAIRGGLIDTSRLRHSYAGLVKRDGF